MDDLDRRLFALLQGDLPLVERPYGLWAESLGVSEGEVLARFAGYLEKGWLRRIGAILYHQRAGFVHNAMGVWQVPAERLEAAGRACAGFVQISHCYRRPTFPGWAYNLYTMIHGKSEAEVAGVVEEIRRASEPVDYKLLEIVREFKKTSMRYFD